LNYVKEQRLVMKLRSVAPPWFNDNPQKQAKCVLFPATKDYDPWYSETEDGGEDYTEDAKAICTGTYDGRPCPLLEACLEFAMINNERYGVWGGLSSPERAQLRKENRKCHQNSSQDGASPQVA
jgi:WhiB family redox-sensing transcriptional regulator